MFAWLFWWRPPCLLQVVHVTTISDQETAVRGVLWQSRGPWLVLRDAALLRWVTPRAGGVAAMQEQAMDGQVVIHRSNVAYLQVLPHADPR